MHPDCDRTPDSIRAKLYGDAGAIARVSARERRGTPII